jgi:capsule polysaccharide export protein KpsE/RkpR
VIPLLLVICRRKKVILAVTAAGFLISAVVSVLLPPTYVASTLFAPAGAEKDLTNLKEFFAPLGSFGESFASYLRARKNYLIDYIIRSRRMSDLIDARFDLRRMYGVTDREEARRKLGEHTAVVIKDEGVIVLSVEDRDRERAIAIAGEYIAQLDTILLNLVVENSRERMQFLNGEVSRRERALSTADSLIGGYLGKFGLYQMEEQVRVMLDIVSDLSSRLSVLDVEKRLLELTMKPGSEGLDRVEFEWTQLRNQLLLLRETGAEPNLFPPFKKLPEISTHYLQFMSERRMQEFMLAYLRLKLADAEVIANSRMSALKVLDPPSAPDRRSWPKRKQIVLVSTAAAFFWASFFMVLDERRKAGREPGGNGMRAGARPGGDSPSGSESV